MLDSYLGLAACSAKIFVNFGRVAETLEVQMPGGRVDATDTIINLDRELARDMMSHALSTPCH